MIFSGCLAIISEKFWRVEVSGQCLTVNDGCINLQREPAARKKQIARFACIIANLLMI